jgi:hypothetical protein
MRADMQAETKRYALQIITCLVGEFAAGVAALALVLHCTLRS